MNRDKLLKLLNEDDEIREAIFNISNQNSSVKDNTKDEFNKEIEMLKTLVAKWKRCFEDEKEQTKTLTKELSQQQEELNADIDRLKKEKNELINSNEQLQSTKDKLENSVQQLQSDNKNIKTSNTNLTKTIEFYEENFKDELKAYELFTSLNTQTKESLYGIFKDSSLQGFLSCGVQDKNISSFWEYIKTELQEDNNSDIKKLVEIYDFLFQEYKRAFPIYETQKVKKGDTFDTEKHINHSSSSAVSGRVTEVLLKGFINTKTSKIIKKSVVRVG